MKEYIREKEFKDLDTHFMCKKMNDYLFIQDKINNLEDYEIVRNSKTGEIDYIKTYSEYNIDFSIFISNVVNNMSAESTVVLTENASRYLNKLIRGLCIRLFKTAAIINPDITKEYIEKAVDILFIGKKINHDIKHSFENTKTQVYNLNRSRIELFLKQILISEKLNVRVYDDAVKCIVSVLECFVSQIVNLSNENIGKICENEYEIVSECRNNTWVDYTNIVDLLTKNIEFRLFSETLLYEERNFKLNITISNK